jgi:hypothetical protein
MEAQHESCILLTGLYKAKYEREDIGNSIPAAINFNMVVN